MIPIDKNNPAISASNANTAVAVPASSGSRFAETLRSVQHHGRDLDPIFARAAQAHGVPQELLRAIAFHESGFETNAVSKSGAMGLMQLMPATAQAMGVTKPFDAEQNVMGGAKLLSQYLEKYDGDLKLTLAAYGAGSGAVAKYDGIPPYKETQKFVEDIMSVVHSGGLPAWDHTGTPVAAFSANTAIPVYTTASLVSNATTPVVTSSSANAAPSAYTTLASVSDATSPIITASGANTAPSAYTALSAVSDATSPIVTASGANTKPSAYTALASVSAAVAPIVAASSVSAGGATVVAAASAIAAAHLPDASTKAIAKVTSAFSSLSGSKPTQLPESSGLVEQMRAFKSYSSQDHDRLVTRLLADINTKPKKDTASSMFYLGV